MTEQTQPTDAEIYEIWNCQPGRYPDPIPFARAVLAKWGTPAGAVEPTEAMIDAGNRARLYREHGDLREEAVLSARTHNTRATWFAMCEAAPQPTQAQAREIAELKAQESELCTLYGLAQAECQKLRTELERTTNNRDMWKSQCERQADELRKLRSTDADSSHSHMCTACAFAYTPAIAGSEDCPQCGWDGRGTYAGKAIESVLQKANHDQRCD